MPNNQPDNVEPSVPNAVAPAPAPAPWKILLVEDNETTRRQIEEYFKDSELSGRHLRIHPINEWDLAFGIIRDHKADMVILDIYRGDAAQGGERVGERVLEEIRRSGFVPVIIHTNLAEGLEGLRNEFVRLVPKTEGLPRLREEMEALCRTLVPQMHRAILNHLDRALCQYMWGFVTKEWTGLQEIANRPEFLRLLLHRLAISFAREGVDQAVAEAFPGHASLPLDPDKVHPAEFYIKPPMARDPALGDIRVRGTGDAKEHLVVLWPTCDMVSTGGRTPKVERILCARASLLATFNEAREFAAGQSNTKRKALGNFLKNNRDTDFADRFHFLPGFLDIPDLVVDFQALEIQPFHQLSGLPCLGVLASPFAEHMSSRFDRYRGRVGTPDLDYEFVINRMIEPAPPAGH